MKAVILAGGEGKRLRPYTFVLPKPLLPVNGEPILDAVLRNLKEQGIGEIYISINYKSHLFEIIYGNGEKIGLNINYLKEEKPLGTAGSLKLLQGKVFENLFVTNGDVICNLNLGELEKFHDENKCDITVVSRKITVPVNFGVLKITNNKIVEWAEKPKIGLEISAGMYLLNPNVLKYIPENSFFNMPDLVKKVIENNGIVMRFLHDGDLIDVSDLDEYEKIQSKKF
ncbi:MAG: NTP transferase domain-containing protein [Nanoarchaeota archaeon]|nr:NTP transferase domain-containing protein [Nanoarchaeota archaeon]